MTLWSIYILRIIIYMLMGWTLATTSRCTIHTVRRLIWRPGYMCRNIKTLFNFEPPATEEEISAASLQYVRKVTGFNKPSKTNEAAFYSAVEDIARISERLLASLETAAPPKDREEEATKAKARSALRFGG
jgi:hypothetical protein